MKVDLSALWQTLTKRTAALLADEQKRTGLVGGGGTAGPCPAGDFQLAAR